MIHDNLRTNHAKFCTFLSLLVFSNKFVSIFETNKESMLFRINIIAIIRKKKEHFAIIAKKIKENLRN